MPKKPQRRDVLCGGTALLAGGLLGIGAGSRRALANNHPHPHEGSLDYIDPKTYVAGCEVHNHFKGGPRIGGKSQMMAIGKRRYLFTGGQVWDVSEAASPVLINGKAFVGRQVQLAFNKKIGKWILMTGAAPPPTSSKPGAPNGKYDDPGLIDSVLNYRGLRGVRIYDATDPANVTLLSMWSCDQGDPTRAVQTGGGDRFPVG